MVLVDETVVVWDHGYGECVSCGVGSDIEVVGDTEIALPLGCYFDLLEHESLTDVTAILVSSATPKLTLILVGLLDLQQHSLN